MPDGAPTLVFLHAFGGSHRSWARTIAALKTECPPLAFDLPGFGDSEDEARPAVNAYADWIEARVAALDKRFVLVGHSMSGKIAMALAAREPARLAGLALIGPSPLTPEPIEAEERRRQLDGFGDAELARRSIEALIVARPSAAVAQNEISDRLKVTAAAWRFWLESGSREDLSALSPKIAAPTLIVSGTDDRAIATAVVQREVAARLPQADFRIETGAGHLMPQEEPERFAGILDAWLSKLR